MDGDRMDQRSTFLVHVAQQQRQNDERQDGLRLREVNRAKYKRRKHNRQPPTSQDVEKQRLKQPTKEQLLGHRRDERRPDPKRCYQSERRIPTLQCGDRRIPAISVLCHLL